VDGTSAPGLRRFDRIAERNWFSICSRSDPEPFFPREINSSSV
jgi:hypothetical protein